MRPLTWYVLLAVTSFAVEGLLATCERVNGPVSMALSSAGMQPSVAELAAEQSLLKQRIAARDDAIELLLLHVDAARDCCDGKAVCR